VSFDRRLPVRAATLAGLLLGLTLGACGGSNEMEIDPGDGGNYSVRLDRAEFVAAIDNRWLPFEPGSRWVYQSSQGGAAERIEVVVTDQTREIVGITATIVRDSETRSGKLIEETFDWYAQDREGNVWYLGEDSKEFHNGEAVSAAGSWQAGVDRALPGIIMMADPRVGSAYRQEYYPGVAEDMAEVVRLGAVESVPFGSLDGLLVNKEWTPLEPDVVEEKYYAPGLGLVLEKTVRGGSDRLELISYEPAG
jgi:hypothetical protein